MCVCYIGGFYRVKSFVESTGVRVEVDMNLTGFVAFNALESCTFTRLYCISSLSLAPTVDT